jgi:hypothetical protein
MPGDASVSGVPASSTADTDTDSGTEATEVSQAQREAEEEARRYHWMSKEEWIADGRDESRWRPATEFLDVRRGVESIVEQKLAAERARTATLEAKLLERERREAEAQGKFTLESLQLERKQARENGDWDRVDELDDKIIDLKLKANGAAQPAQPAQPAMPPGLEKTLLDFRAENQAIFKDPYLTVDFTVRLKSIIEAGVVPDIATALKHAKRQVMRDNPEKFLRLNGDRSRVPMLEMGGTTGAATGGRTWNDLKPEFRKVGEETIRKFKGVTKEEYLANCDADAFRR